MIKVIAVLALVAGFLLGGFGAVSFFAGAQSDNPEAGHEASDEGGKLLAFGSFLIVFAVVALWLLGR